MVDEVSELGISPTQYPLLMLRMNLRTSSPLISQASAPSACSRRWREQNNILRKTLLLFSRSFNELGMIPPHL